MRCDAMRCDDIWTAWLKKNEEQGESGNEVRVVSVLFFERWGISLLRLQEGEVVRSERWSASEVA